jgi:hypothetical protein
VTQEFDHVRAAFASSVPGRLLSGTQHIIASSWASSSFGSAVRRAALAMPPATGLVRMTAIAIAIAAALQPVLIVMMPRTARSWMPWIVFGVTALLALTAASRPDAIVMSWTQSRLARWLRR